MNWQLILECPPLKEGVHGLGVLLDLALHLAAQVLAMAQGAFAWLSLLHQLHPFVDHALFMH